MAAAYDAHAHEREEAGEPDWRDDIRADFAGRVGPGNRVLEVGAGVGYTAKWFADQGFEVIATDLSPGNVDLIRAKGVAAEVRDMADLGFDDGSFAGVWAASCLMHIPTPELDGVFAEIERVLAPGGWFWAGTWGSDEPVEGPWEDDWYEPKRFYAIRDDGSIVAAYESRFEVVAFESFEPMDVDWHYQSALMRRRSD